MKVFAKAALQAISVDHEAENRRLKRELTRMAEERVVIKKRWCFQSVFATFRLIYRLAFQSQAFFLGVYSGDLQPHPDHFENAQTG